MFAFYTIQALVQVFINGIFLVSLYGLLQLPTKKGDSLTASIPQKKTKSGWMRYLFLIGLFMSTVITKSTDYNRFKRSLFPFLGN